MDFSATLIRWYEENGRDLPWRHTRNPWNILVSEVILQQTRVAQGYEYYLRFMKRFPDAAAMAAASEDEVLSLWQGLGYYSRARHLHEASRQIVQSGHFPDTWEGVRNLRGVGDYTAAAVCSLAYGLPTPVVDGNVLRVLSRYMGINQPIDTLAGKKAFKQMAEEMMDRKNPATYNQAIMDFGAIQCTPRSPRCTDCPLRETCMALNTNQVESLPCKSRKTRIEDRHILYVFTVKDHTTWLRKRPSGDIWQGLYEPWSMEFASAPAEEEILRQLTTRYNGKEYTFHTIGQTFVHVLTHRRLHIHTRLIQIGKAPVPEAGNGFIEVPFSRLSDYPVCVPIARLLSEVIRISQS